MPSHRRTLLLLEEELVACTLLDAADASLLQSVNIITKKVKRVCQILLLLAETLRDIMGSDKTPTTDHANPKSIANGFRVVNCVCVST